MNWDAYFHTVCEAVASKSPCLSRQIGVVLVKDHSIISTGYNGPPRGIPHCGADRIAKDKVLSDIIHEASHDKENDLWIPSSPLVVNSTCPRRLLGYASGTHMELCHAQHAEENAVSNAARSHANTLNSTLYMNSIIPCSKCFGTLINAGIIEIVVDEATIYDKHTQFLIDNSYIKIREFIL